MTGSPHDHPVHLLGPAALGLLTSVEQTELDAHLSDCAACAAELPLLGRLVDEMSVLSVEEAAGEGLAPAAAITESVLAAIARERSSERQRAQRMQTVFAAAAAVAVLFAGVLTAATLRTAEQPKVPLESVAVQANAGVDATADLVAHTWGVEIKLAASGLSAGRPYRVRVMTATGAVVDAGAFLGTGKRTLTCNLNASVLREDARGFAVVDPSGRSVVTATL